LLNRDDAFDLEWAAGTAPADARRADPERWDRIADRIRSESVREALDACRSGASDASGERFRVALRLLVAPYLAVSAGQARDDRPAAGSEARRREWLDEATFAEGRAERAAAGRRLRDDAERHGEEDGLLRRALDDAARRAGADGVLDLLAATVPGGDRGLPDGVERGALEPLDAAVARGADARWRRSPWRDREAASIPEEDVPYLERLADRAAEISPRTVRRVLRGIEGPFAGGGLGSWSRGGPGGLREGLAALGLSLRDRTRADSGAWPGSDPAFRWATSELFARIGERSRGIEAWSPPLDEATRRDRAFEASLVPRVAWAMAAGEPAGRDAEARRLLRATSRPASVARFLGVGAIPAEPTARLRGVLLAVLLEERLLTRHGYRFWEAEAARTLLRDLWASEAQETPRSVASALALGTMDPSPLADAYRP
jgi:hypothetical protein